MEDQGLKAIYLEDLYSRIKRMIQEAEAELGVREGFAMNCGLLKAMAEIEKRLRSS